VKNKFICTFEVKLMTWPLLQPRKDFFTLVVSTEILLVAKPESFI